MPHFSSLTGLVLFSVCQLPTNEQMEVVILMNLLVYCLVVAASVCKFIQRQAIVAVPVELQSLDVVSVATKAGGVAERQSHLRQC